MFFSPDFEARFEHRGKELRVGSVLPHNKKLIADGLQYMSPESIRNRFLGIKSGFSDRELNYLTNLDGLNHYALGVQEMFDENRGVAIIRMVRLQEDPDTAEIAITIIDSYQRQGLGSLLLDLILLAALERNIKNVFFTYLPQNSGIEKLIQKKGAHIAGERSQDFIQYNLDIRGQEEVIKARLKASLPQIDSYRSGI